MLAQSHGINKQERVHPLRAFSHSLGDGSGKPYSFVIVRNCIVEQLYIGVYLMV